jgi:WD40 repeat protein
MVTFSPDGTRIATGNRDDPNAGVWDVATGKQLLKLTGFSARVPGVAFSQDGTLLAAASHDGTIRIWDAAKGTLKEILNTPEGGTNRVAFSPDGIHLASLNNDGTVWIYTIPIKDLVALAKSRLTRPFTTAECQQYLHTDICPAG